MKKLFLPILSVIVLMVMSGCGSTTPTIELETYNKAIAERNSLKTELDELKENTVSKDEYDVIVEERDRLNKKLSDYEDIVAERNKLKLTVAEYEKSIAAEQKNEESNKDVSTDNNVNKADDIELPQCPIYYEDCGFTHYNITIDSFDADVLPVYGGLQVKIVYTVSGVTDDTAGAAYLKVFCYDKDGYSIDTSMMRLSSAVANEPFKIKGEMVVDAATAKIVFDKP